MIKIYKLDYLLWYGCYMNNNNIICFGPYNSHNSAEFNIKCKLGSNYKVVPSKIISVCAFMPEFMKINNINKKLFIGKDQIIPIKMQRD